MAIPDLNQGEKCRPPVFPVDEKNWNICEQMRLSLTDALAAYGLWTEEEGKCGSQRWVGVALVAREEEHQRGSSIKLRYVYEAVEDKQRYIRELQAYQSSKAYRAFLRRRAAHKVQALCGTGTLGCEFESEGLDFSAIDRPWDELKFSAVLRKASTRQAISQGDENDDLYCRTCRQFFSSLHNKREHLLGKQHLQNLTGEFEKDSAECLKHLEPLEGEVGQNLNKGDSEEEAECPDPLPLRGLIPETSFASLDLRFLQEFIFKLLKIKEFELRELRKTLERAQVEQEALQRQLLEFQNRRQRLEVELAGLKTYGVVLEKEFENLNMVLMLSHFGLRVIDTT
nr:uncharacterized protein LOC115857102 [Globicephala melas]